MDACYRSDDQISTDLCRIVHIDLEAVFEARPHYFDMAGHDLAQSLGHDSSDRRHYGSDDRPGDLCSIDIVKIENIFKCKSIFQCGFAVISGETLGKADLFSVNASDHHVCITNVNSEKHAVPPYSVDYIILPPMEAGDRLLDQ